MILSEFQDVTVVEQSGNGKIGIISATYASQASCPPCAMEAACYGNMGHTAITTNRVNKSAVRNPNVIAAHEAHVIRKLTGRFHLRVHVVGDCRTNKAARLVSTAMLEHEAKAGKAAWTYTHGWRKVARASWQAANVQASCESAADVVEANARGYATALVVDGFKSTKAYVHNGAPIIPCPQQTGRVATCEKCQLCLNPVLLAARLAKGQSIGFEPDTNTTKKVAAALGPQAK